MASHANPAAFEASSSAPIAVGVGAPPEFVPSQGRATPSLGVVVRWASVTTWPSKIVSETPSTRRLTVTGAASRGRRGECKERQRHWERCPAESIEHRATPSSRVVWASAGVRSPASDSAPRLPGEPSAHQWLDATHQRPFTVAGPRGICTQLPWPPAVERSEHTPPRHTLPRPLKSLAAILPPSSRGLGRRPLTAETGVRIPVAVLLEPAQ